MITNRGAAVLLAGTVVAVGLAGTVVAVGLAAHHALPSHPDATFTIHIEYGAQEDMISCPGTPGRVVNYEPDWGTSANVTCRVADIPR